MRYSLPGLPPTVNHMYRHRGKITYKTADAKAWIKSCLWELQQQDLPDTPIAETVRVSLTFLSPDRRRWDIDNRVKAVQDLLMEAGIIEDDSLVWDLNVRRLRSDETRTDIEVEAIA